MQQDRVFASLLDSRAAEIRIGGGENPIGNETQTIAGPGRIVYYRPEGRPQLAPEGAPMAKRTRPNPADFTVAQLEAMLAAKTQIDELEAQRAALLKELDKVEKDLAKLLSGKVTSKRPVRKKAAKKAAKRAAKRSAKKATRKRAAKKVAKKSAKKSSRRKATKKAASAKARPTIESVIVDLLTKKGEPMAFKEILGEIQKRKLVTSKAADFSNVLRRTLSTSERVKRVGRGVYSI